MGTPESEMTDRYKSRIRMRALSISFIDKRLTPTSFSTKLVYLGTSETIMMLLRVAALILLTLTPPLFCQARVLSKGEIRQAAHSLPAIPPTNRQILTEDHYAVKVAKLDHRTGPGELHRTEDRIFFGLKGSATVCTGGSLLEPKVVDTGESQGSGLAGCTPLAIRPGSVISVPRGTGYQMQAPLSKVEFLVVRIK
jgi:hypothetical protein